MYLKLLLMLASLLLSVPSLGKQHFVSLHKMDKQADSWRLKFSVPYTTNYSVFLLDNPKRLVVDLLDDKLQPKNCRVNLSIVKRCRTGRLDGKRARFVLDLKQKIVLQNSTLTQRNKKHYLDINFALEKSKQEKEIQFVQQVQSINSKRKKGKKYIVVIDAGHGGNQDIGSSYSGTDEKDLTLQYAKELRVVLAKEKNLDVRMTRTKDDFMLLANRLLLARRGQADMLISIHADWNADPKVKGIAVYSQSNYAAEKYARRFLEDSTPKIINGEEWQNSMPSAYDILFDITQRTTLNRSIFLSRTLLKTIRLYTPVLDQPHRFADFHLLSAPDVPSVLLELGFLSNQQDWKKLKSKKWRAGLSKRIARGVRTYFAHLPQLKAQNIRKTHDKNDKKQYSIVKRTEKE